MKAEKLKFIIINILAEKPRFFDGVCAKDIKNLLLAFRALRNFCK